MKKLAGLLAELLIMAAAFAIGEREVTVCGQTFAFMHIDGTGVCMGMTEVTQAQYDAVMGENPSRFKGPDLPVESVSWYDAIVFCNKLSKAAGLAPVYAVDDETDSGKWNYTPHRGERISGRISQDLNASGFRLPTGEEWEYAARGGQDQLFAGSDSLDEVGWYLSNSGGRPHPVAGKKANGYGLYDMSGNVWEWVWDRYEHGNSERYYRGGSWYYGTNYSRVPSSWYYFPYYRGDFIGLRLLCPASGR